MKTKIIVTGKIIDSSLHVHTSISRTLRFAIFKIKTSKTRSYEGAMTIGFKAEELHFDLLQKALSDELHMIVSGKYCNKFGSDNYFLVKKIKLLKY